MADPLLTAVSGLQVQQTMLDVVGNNLANVNTVGFKAQDVQFQDLYYETLSKASQNLNDTQSSNPIQVGLGATVAAVNTDFSNGGLETTGKPLDLAIQGNGFFVVNNGVQNVYTRAGSFNVSDSGYLVDPSTGNYVQRTGVVGETGTPALQVPGSSNIKIPIGAGIPAEPTTAVTFQGNLNAGLTVGQSYSTSIQVYDTKGSAHSFTADFTKTAVGPSTYSVTLTVSGGRINGSTTDSAPVTLATPITFNANGTLQSPASISGINISFPTVGLAAAQPITLNVGALNGTTGLTEFGNASSAAAISQDGSAAGSLVSVSVASDGTVNGIFSNSRNIPIAQIAIASFSNPGGLERAGSNDYALSANSGPPIVGTAGSGALGNIQSGSLEQSNVDVGLEFTKLIVAQRGYQVNARTISTVDQTLQSLISIQ